MVEGEAGIGKTTLLVEAAAEAQSQGFHVLTAQGSPAEVTYAYAGVADLLRDVDVALFDALPDLQRIALERTRIGDIDIAGPATDERIVATALLSVIEGIGRRSPVLVIIDDAQWLDASSRAVIGFAARRLNGPVGMVLSFRTGDPDAHDDRAWLQFRRPETAMRVTMRPLSLAALHTLVAARLGHSLPRPAITRIHELSAGNPFFAIELAVAAADDMAATTFEIPDTLAALVRHRVGHTGDEAAAVLLAAACSVAPTAESVAQAVDRPVERVIELLESMEHLHIVALDGNRVRFTHPLFAAGVYSNATPSQRRAVHRTLAGIVERPELKARHLALAATTGDSTTLAALDAAVEVTIARGAPAVAAELVELGLKLSGEDTPRRIRAGELHFRAGSLAAARLHLETALRSEPSGILRCLALMWLGAIKGYDDDMAGAVEAMTQSVEEAGGNPAVELLCLLRLALALVMADRLPEALPRGERAVALADQLGIPNLRSQALSIWVVGKFIAGQGVDHEALQTALDLEDPYGGATTFFQASAVEAMISAYTGDLERAWLQMRAVQQRMLAHGTEVDITWAAVHIAGIAMWCGRYGDAFDATQEAAERAEQIGGRLILVTAWTQQAAVAAYTGREADARAAARAAIDTANEIRAMRLVREPTISLAFLEVSLGNYPAALELLEPFLTIFAENGGAETEIEGGGYLPDVIETLAAVGRADEIEVLVEALERNGLRYDRPWMLAMGARGRGHMLASRGDLAGAQQAVEQALIHHRRLPMPFEAARSRLLLGQLQRRRRRKSDGGASLREALSTFERLNAPIWAARARTELERLDGARSDGQRLTAAEERTARLAAAGQSNKEIAAATFLSEKTVETYLTAVYRKLGVRSRAGLSSALQSEG